MDRKHPTEKELHGLMTGLAAMAGAVTFVIIMVCCGLCFMTGLYSFLRVCGIKMSSCCVSSSNGGAEGFNNTAYMYEIDEPQENSAENKSNVPKNEISTSGNINNTTGATFNIHDSKPQANINGLPEENHLSFNSPANVPKTTTNQINGNDRVLKNLATQALSKDSIAPQTQTPLESNKQSAQSSNRDVLPSERISPEGFNSSNPNNAIAADYLPSLSTQVSRTPPNSPELTIISDNECLLQVPSFIEVNLKDNHECHEESDQNKNNEAISNSPRDDSNYPQYPFNGLESNTPPQYFPFFKYVNNDSCGVLYSTVATDRSKKPFPQSTSGYCSKQSIRNSERFVFCNNVNVLYKKTEEDTVPSNSQLPQAANVAQQILAAGIVHHDHSYNVPITVIEPSNTVANEEEVSSESVATGIGNEAGTPLASNTLDLGPGGNATSPTTNSEDLEENARDQ